MPHCPWSQNICSLGFVSCQRIGKSCYAYNFDWDLFSANRDTPSPFEFWIQSGSVKFPRNTPGSHIGSPFHQSESFNMGIRLNQAASNIEVNRKFHAIPAHVNLYLPTWRKLSDGEGQATYLKTKLPSWRPREMKSLLGLIGLSPLHIKRPSISVVLNLINTFVLDPDTL